MVGFGLALAEVLSGIMMGVVGFVPDAVTQPVGAVTGLRTVYTLVPAAGALLAMGFMRDCDLTEARARETRDALEARRGVSALA